jgi:hypothetical protein
MGGIEFWIRNEFEFCFFREPGVNSGELTPNISNQIKTTCINHVGVIIITIKKQKNK